MRCLLLALSVALACATRDVYVLQAQENLDVQKVAGTWYSMAMAASDFALLSTESAPLRLYIKELRPTPKDDLEIIGHRREDGRCIEEKIFAKKTEAPAEFKTNSLGDSKVRVVDTDYKTFAILCLENMEAAQQRLACQYLARTPKINEMAMEQFSRVMKLIPMHIQLIFTPTQAEERCRV